MLKKNLRRHARIYLEGQVGVAFTGQRQTTYPIIDISLSGMLIRGQFHQEIDSPCTITFTVRRHDMMFIMSITSRVSRNNPRGTAVQFTTMDQLACSLLQTILLYKSTEPLMFGQEFSQHYPFVVSENTYSDISTGIRSGTH
jgi:hypothetical protein